MSKAAARFAAMLRNTRADEETSARIVRSVQGRMRDGETSITRDEIAAYKNQCAQLQKDMYTLSEYIGTILTQQHRGLLESIARREQSLAETLSTCSNPSVRKAFTSMTEEPPAGRGSLGEESAAYQLFHALKKAYLPLSEDE